LTLRFLGLFSTGLKVKGGRGYIFLPVWATLHIPKMVCATPTCQLGQAPTFAHEYTKLRIFLRFRMGLHDLPIATGRLRGIPRHERWYDQCSLHVVGDKQHFVFYCPSLQQVRDRYPDLFHLPICTLQQFLWQEDIIQVIKLCGRLFCFAPNKTTAMKHFVVKNSSRICGFYLPRQYTCELFQGFSSCPTSCSFVAGIIRCPAGNRKQGGKFFAKNSGEKRFWNAAMKMAKTSSFGCTIIAKLDPKCKTRAALSLHGSSAALREIENPGKTGSSSV
jgi:hypothetical protein